MNDRVKKYQQVRERKRLELKEKGKYVCFFCSLPLPLHDEGVDCHHLIGRDNDTIYDEKYLVFAHHQCHMEYHFNGKEPVWWHHFLIKMEREYPEIKLNKWRK